MQDRNTAQPNRRDVKAILREWANRAKKAHGWKNPGLAERIGVATRSLVNSLQANNTRYLIHWEAAKSLADLAEATPDEWEAFQLEWVRWRLARPAHYTHLTIGVFNILERIAPSKLLAGEIAKLLEENADEDKRGFSHS